MNGAITELIDFTPSMFQQVDTPLISLYLQTHRHAPDNQQDRMRFKNLISEVESLLSESHNRREYADMIVRLEFFLEDLDRNIWQHAKDGLAIFVDQGSLYYYRLDYPVQDIAVVDNEFYVKPLIRNFQYGAHYYLLALSADSFELLCGDFHGIDPVCLPEGIESRFEDIFDDFDNNSSVNAGSYGGLDASYHGHRSKSEMVEKDIEKFFRYVDKTIAESFLADHPYPVILVSLPQHQATFRSIASMPTLLESGIEKPFEAFTESELFKETISLIQEVQKSHIKKLVESYGLAEAKEKGSSEPSTIAHALAQRKVATLFIEQDRLMPGKIDRVTGLISYSSNDEVGIHDLAENFVRMTYLQGGAVFILEKEMMPSDTGVAALFRY